VSKLFSEADSIGMNERETLDIYRAMGGDTGSMDTDDLVGKKVSPVPLSCHPTFLHPTFLHITFLHSTFLHLTFLHLTFLHLPPLHLPPPHIPPPFSTPPIFQVKNVPNIALVTKVLAYVLDHAPKTGGRRLSRIAYHCLPFHIIAERTPDSGKLFASAGPALAHGSIVGTTRACDITPAEVTEDHLIWMAPKNFEPVPGQKLTLSPTNPNPIWTMETSESQYQFTLVPLMVCAHIKKTVGLGDTVSATGLAYSF
jgi:hypothetical protein